MPAGRVDVLLTGDLNDQSQADIIEAYGDQFVDEWRVDVAKACHHGSHHQDFDFLRGVGALSTVFSSGDANTYDHPRAWVLGAASLAGRVVEDRVKARLKAPLIYSTEIARSLGNPVVKNVVALGALQEASQILSDDSILTALRGSLADKCAVIPVNEEAYAWGVKAVREGITHFSD